MNNIYLGTDSGATTSKTCGVYADGTPISLELAQSSTNSQSGTNAVIDGWIEGIEKFLMNNRLVWDQVRGVGLAIPGPYQATAFSTAQLTFLPPSPVGIFMPTIRERSPVRPDARFLW